MSPPTSPPYTTLAESMTVAAVGRAMADASLVPEPNTANPRVRRWSRSRYQLRADPAVETAAVDGFGDQAPGDLLLVRAVGMSAGVAVGKGSRPGAGSGGGTTIRRQGRVKTLQ